MFVILRQLSRRRSGRLPTKSLPCSAEAPSEAEGEAEGTCATPSHHLRPWQERNREGHGFSFEPALSEAEGCRKSDKKNAGFSP